MPKYLNYVQVRKSVQYKKMYNNTLKYVPAFGLHLVPLRGAA